MEERLQFLATGTKPKKNKDAMKEVLDELKAEGLYFETTKGDKKGEDKTKKAKKSKKVADSDDDESEEEVKPKK